MLCTVTEQRLFVVVTEMLVVVFCGTGHILVVVFESGCMNVVSVVGAFWVVWFDEY